MTAKKDPKDIKPSGRPAKYKTVEEMEAAISSYFNWWCKTKTIYVKTGKDDYEAIEQPIPTITWLALYLGFVNRASMYDYEWVPEFSNTIKRARAFMEQEYEELLRHNPTGAIFALKNFWRTDKHQTELTWAEWWPVQIKSILDDLIK